MLASAQPMFSPEALSQQRRSRRTILTTLTSAMIVVIEFKGSNSSSQADDVKVLFEVVEAKGNNRSRCGCKMATCSFDWSPNSNHALQWVYLCRLQVWIARDGLACN